MWQLLCKNSWVRPPVKQNLCKLCKMMRLMKLMQLMYLTSGALLEVQPFKKCRPLWCEAHLELKMYKTPQSRNTFGTWDVEKVHAVVTRSTFRSQNVQSCKATQPRSTFGSWDATLHDTTATTKTVLATSTTTNNNYSYNYNYNYHNTTQRNATQRNATQHNTHTHSHTHCGVMMSGKCEWCHCRRLMSWVTCQ